MTLAASFQIADAPTNAPTVPRRGFVCLAHTLQIVIHRKNNFAKGIRLVGAIAREEGRVLHDTATMTGEDVLPGSERRVSDLLA